MEFNYVVFKKKTDPQFSSNGMHYAVCVLFI